MSRKLAGHVPGTLFHIQVLASSMASEVDYVVRLINEYDLVHEGCRQRMKALKRKASFQIAKMKLRTAYFSTAWL